jgi:RNA polymerase sigma-70 factor (family 1)
MAPELLTSDEDYILLEQLRNDSRPAFDKLYQKYWKFVFNLTYKRIKDVDRSEDIAQDIFTKIWFNRAEIAIKNIPAYLATAVKNSVFTYLAKESKYIPVNEKHLEIEMQGGNADAAIILEDFIKAYEALIDNLPNQQREVFKMRFNNELNPDEIAFKLHLSPKTVRNHLGRALSTLRAALFIIIWTLAFYIS